LFNIAHDHSVLFIHITVTKKGGEVMRSWVLRVRPYASTSFVSGWFTFTQYFIG